MKQLNLILILLLAVNISYAESELCRSFAKQADAQDYFEARKRYWRELDRDLDGEACECLMGGSQYHNKQCIIWRITH